MHMRMNQPQISFFFPMLSASHKQAYVRSSTPSGAALSNTAAHFY